ncbi:MAG: DUF3048 domain-containing protein [Actinomycetota bacterium]
MALTRRGRTVVVVGALVVLGAGAIGAAYITRPAGASLGEAITEIVAPDPICPLTGVRATGDEVPARPVLAVKIENSPLARPQAGLNDADIVYEEPVEGGITRFIALYQCGDVDRLGPVRSARTTDPDVLVQYGTPLMAYSGGAGQVVALVRQAGLLDVGFETMPDLYERDPAREAPHDIFSSTAALWGGASWSAAAPDPVFTFDADPPAVAKRAARVHLDFSASSDVWWTWDAAAGLWLRAHGDTPHVLEGGEQVSATTVVVQVVEVRPGTIIDAAGNPSPEVTLVGTGKVYVFRGGQVVVGRWVRDALDQVTRLEDADGNEIALAPGRTWVELLPSTVAVEIVRKAPAA